MKPSRLALLLAATAAACAAGCKAPPKPMKFNKMLAASNAKLAESGKAFRKTVEPLAEGKQVTPSAVESAYRNMESTLASLRDEWDDQKPPIRSSSGPDLLEKYQAFLDAEGKVLQVYQNVVKVAQDGGLPPKDKWSRINAFLQAGAAEEGKAMQPLRVAQTAYAKEHNIQLEQMFFMGGGGPSMTGMSGGGSRGGPPGGGSRGGPPGGGSRGGPPGRGGPPQ